MSEAGESKSLSQPYTHDDKQMEKVDATIEKLLQKYLEFMESANEFAEAFKEAYYAEGMAAVDITLQKLRKHAYEKLKGNPDKQLMLADIEYMIAKLNSELTAGATYEIERCPTCPHTTYTIKELQK